MVAGICSVQQHGAAPRVALHLLACEFDIVPCLFVAAVQDLAVASTNTSRARKSCVII